MVAHRPDSSVPVRALVASLCLATGLSPLLLPAKASSQEQTSQPFAPGATLQVQSHLIEMTAAVRDARGEPVTGLGQAAFSITEDGAPQTVRYFAQGRELPLSIGLIVDASGSQEKFVKAHEQAVEAFLREILEPKDQALAVCFGNHLRLVSDWTNSAAALTAALHRFDKGDRDFAEVGPKEERELGTALYDAVYFPLAERFGTGAERRKVLLLLTDGEENASEHDLLDAIHAAQDGNVLIYAVRTTTAKADRMDARDRYGVRALEHLTEESGGRVFDASTTRLEDDFAEIATELRSLYELGYYSTHHERGVQFRKVTVGLEDKQLQVRARSGYTSH